MAVFLVREAIEEEALGQPLVGHVLDQITEEGRAGILGKDRSRSRVTALDLFDDGGAIGPVGSVRELDDGHDPRPYVSGFGNHEGKARQPMVGDSPIAQDRPHFERVG